MAYDAGLAQLMRADLAGLDDLREQPMFGGLCFMKSGHMLCGIHRTGALYRVGKARQAAALAIAGAAPMVMGGRHMGGLIDVTPAAMVDEASRAAWLGIALEFVAGLPPKQTA